jgi:hypothetical protein
VGENIGEDLGEAVAVIISAGAVGVAGESVAEAGAGVVVEPARAVGVVAAVNGACLVAQTARLAIAMMPRIATR